ncbi:hypothetical protein [Gynuella sp.]|uniref:hypothetical protein n=1 Tax=Gynuella sp. TaxID=2969146 RepID=UPI003D128ABE
MKETSLEQITRLYDEYSTKLNHHLSLEKNKIKNKNGVHTFSTATFMYTGAVSAWVAKKDIRQFSERSNSSIARLAGLFECSQQGKNIYNLNRWEYYHEFFSLALSFNSVSLAKEMAEYCSTEKLKGSFEPPPYSVEWTLSLKYLILDIEKEGKKWLAEFHKRSGNKSNLKYLGYANAMQAIWDRNESAFIKALDHINEHYPKQINSNAMFWRIDQHFFSQYGIALVYLAHSKGMNIVYENTYFPADMMNLPEHHVTPYIPTPRGLLRQLIKDAVDQHKQQQDHIKKNKG